MPQGIAYTIDYKAERDLALEQVQELKETVALLQRAVSYTHLTLPTKRIV